MSKSTPEYAGIDGCRDGWFYIAISDEGNYRFGLETTFSQAISALKSAKLILVDMPIGLPTAVQPQRYCDVAARKAIAPRGSSVFPVPARSALSQPDYEAACAENKRALGKKLSIQSWAIAPKIKEVDDYLRGMGKNSQIREMHPEVAFWALNAESPLLHKKKKFSGQKERLEILLRHYPQAEVCFESCKAAFLRKQVAKDDILDALVGAVTAMQAPNLGTMPPNPVFDEAGLPMEIVFAKVSRDPSLSEGLYHHEVEAAAAQILGLIIFAFTRFEFNLALAIRLIEVSPGDPKFNFWKDKLNFKGKLARLLSFAEQTLTPQSKVAIQFHSWYRNMELVRKKRNAFVHGRWWVEHSVQQIINVSEDYPGTGEKGVNRFSLGELQRELDDIQRLSLEFSRLSRAMQI